MVGRCFSQYSRPQLKNKFQRCHKFAPKSMVSSSDVRYGNVLTNSWAIHRLKVQNWIFENSTGSGCGELSWKPLCTCNATYIVGWDDLKQTPHAVALRWITTLPCNICDNQATLSLPSRGNTTLWLHRWKRNQHANFNLHAWKTSKQNYPNQFCRNYG